MRQFILDAFKGALPGAVIGGFAGLALVGGEPANLVIGGFIGALIGARVSLRSHTPSLAHGPNAHINPYMHDANSDYFHGSVDHGQSIDIGGFDGGGTD